MLHEVLRRASMAWDVDVVLAGAGSEDAQMRGAESARMLVL